MPLIDAWKLVVLERYAKFDGRAGRAEFWWFALANFILYFVLGLLFQVSAIFVVVYIIAVLALIVPSIAVTVRRLHDTDKTGWLVLLAFIPFVGSIILIVLCAIAGDQGANQYGPVPEGV